MGIGDWGLEIGDWCYALGIGCWWLGIGCWLGKTVLNCGEDFGLVTSHWNADCNPHSNFAVLPCYSVTPQHLGFVLRASCFVLRLRELWYTDCTDCTDCTDFVASCFVLRLRFYFSYPCLSVFIRVPYCLRLVALCFMFYVLRICLPEQLKLSTKFLC